jgi:hypothetical protein
MAQSDSRRLYIVLPYLYPDLVNQAPLLGGDYFLQNDLDGSGTQLHWHKEGIAEPTAQQLADGKEAAINAYWWKLLKRTRDRLLVNSDWSQGADVPSATKNAYVTYRTDLRDLPTTVTKPDFATLNNQSVGEWDINSLMPTKPGE